MLNVLTQALTDNKLRGRTRVRAPDGTQCSSHYTRHALILSLLFLRKILQKSQYPSPSRNKLSVHIVLRGWIKASLPKWDLKDEWSCLGYYHPTFGCLWRHGRF